MSAPLTALVPFAVVTVISTAPAACAGEVAVIEVAFTTAKLAAAEKQIAATRTTAMSNVRGIAEDAAGAIVQRLTGVLPDGKTVSSAVDATLKG